MKCVSIYGVCRPLEVVFGITKIEREEDKDYSFSRYVRKIFGVGLPLSSAYRKDIVWSDFLHLGIGLGGITVLKLMTICTGRIGSLDQTIMPVAQRGWIVYTATTTVR